MAMSNHGQQRQNHIERPDNTRTQTPAPPPVIKRADPPSSQPSFLALQDRASLQRYMQSINAPAPLSPVQKQSQPLGKPAQPGWGEPDPKRLQKSPDQAWSAQESARLTQLQSKVGVPLSQDRVPPSQQQGFARRIPVSAP